MHCSILLLFRSYDSNINVGKLLEQYCDLALLVLNQEGNRFIWSYERNSKLFLNRSSRRGAMIENAKNFNLKGSALPVEKKMLKKNFEKKILK